MSFPGKGRIMSTKYQGQPNERRHAEPVMYPISGGEKRRTKKILRFAPVLLAGLMTCAARAGAGPADTNTAGAKIQFATPVHNFGKIKGGEMVSYTYIFTNLGDRLLEVSNVQASCGCTTAGVWSRQVDPGKTGSIPIQFNSGNFRGDVTKMITVTCNDASQPAVMLQLMAVEIFPRRNPGLASSRIL
jgi:hypothetical protein